MSHFYFALTNTDVEPLLKEEVALYYPDLKLSYSRPGFLTFKGERKINFSPLFCRLSGNCTGKVDMTDLKLKKFWIWKRDPEFTIPNDLLELSEKSFYKVGDEVTLLLMIGPTEFWQGFYVLQKHHLQTPGEESSILVKEVPSRAYYKIAEAFEAMDLPMEEGEWVLELGSAPGGASLFLLDQGMKVLGVDPAEMDPIILKNKNFKHLKVPFETLTENSFGDVDWIVSDVNLPPTVVLKEIDRLLIFLKPKGLVLTLKMNQDKHFRLLDAVVTRIKEKGFKRVTLKYLPSHRKEIALIALRS